MKHSNTRPYTVGKYLITPISQSTGNGRHLASLSIRSGQGIGTHCRIFSFSREFKSREKALIHAADQGLIWLENPQAFA
ncbi:hypothetical protein [Methylobacillus sp.]|uniref:hypothetical protein n=1 Tax=Methylobacillus sp. TaxID=56818 RepID=UPI002FE245FA